MGDDQHLHENRLWKVFGQPWEAFEESHSPRCTESGDTPSAAILPHVQGWIKQRRTERFRSRLFLSREGTAKMTNVRVRALLQTMLVSRTGIFSGAQRPRTRRIVAPIGRSSIVSSLWNPFMSQPEDVPAHERLNENDVQAIDHLRDAYAQLRKELGRVIVGQKDVIERLAICLFARGHALLMGVPGLAKTLMVNKLAETMSLKFSRIQFTPDLMPMDITGTDILQDSAEGRREFQFVHGPVFANIVLADEINRAPPKTQAAMLEAMQEHNVTVLGKVFHLDAPFLVLATQNPVEQEGTYPLPEAQLDRFMFLIELDYPSEAEEIQIARTTTGEALPTLDHLMSPQDILRHQSLVRRVPGAGPHLLLRGQAGAQDPSAWLHGPGVAQAAGLLGRRSARRPVPHPGRQGPRGPARQLHGPARGHPGGRRTGAHAPHHHHLRGPGRGHRRQEDRPQIGRGDASRIVIGHWSLVIGRELGGTALCLSLSIDAVGPAVSR